LNQIFLTADGLSYNPTIINWGSIPTYFNDAYTYNTNGQLDVNLRTNGGDYLYTGDVNGDGKTDVLRLIIQGSNYLMTNIAGMTTTPILTTLPASYIDLRLLDWDNDGIDELLIHRTDVNGSDIIDYYKYNNGWTKTLTRNVSYGANNNPSHYYGDINGDGIIERVTTSGNIIVSIENHNGTIISDPQYGLYLTDENTDSNENKDIDDIKFLDFDGDGQAELLFHRTANAKNGTLAKYCIFKFLISDKTFLKEQELNWNAIPNNVYIADFSCDGYADILEYETYVDAPDVHWHLYYSNGVAFINRSLPPGFSSVSPYVTNYIAPLSSVCTDDINSDGKADIICSIPANPGSSLNIYLSNGDGFSNAITKTGLLSGSTYVSTAQLDYPCLTASPEPRRILFGSSTTSYLIFSFPTFLNANLNVTGITDGNNTNTAITYKYAYTATDQTAAQPTDALCSLFPISYKIIKEKVFLPASIVTSNTKSTVRSTTSYDFKDALYYPYKGFLGFKTFKVTDAGTGAITTTTFTPTISDGTNTFVYPFASSSTSSRGGLTGSSTTTMVAKEVSKNDRQFIPVTTSQSSYSSATGFTTTNTNTFDENTGKVTYSKSESGTWKVENSTDYDLVSGYIFRPSSSTVTKTVSGQTPYSSTTSYTYGNTSFPLRATKIDAVDKTTEFLSFDAYGNPTNVKVTGGTDVRTSSTTYDGAGRFAIENIDALGYKTSATYRSGDGAVLSKTDQNGLTTTMSYSSGGSSFSSVTTFPTGITSTNTLAWKTSGGLYQTTSSVLYGNTSTKVFDGLGLQIGESNSGHNGRTLTTSKTYKTIGLDSTSTDVAGVTTTYGYDLAGRITSESGTGINNTYSYGTNTVTSTNNLTNSAGSATTSTKTTDAMGNVTNISGTNGTIAYHYYSHGKVKEIIANGATTSMEYNDAALNQTKLIDPDAGTINYTYNGFGQLLTQTDAKGSSITCTYDAGGRLLTKTGPVSVTNSYSTATGQLGSLASTTRDGITESYTYDALCRTTAITTTGGAVTPGGSLGTFTTGYTYNNKNQLVATSYPTGLTVNYTYDNTYGYLTGISNTAGVAIWTGGSTNSLDQWTGFSQNNGTVTTSIGYDATTHMPNSIQTSSSLGSILNLSYSYNASGQMTGRSETGAHITGTTISETFSYDALNRLTQDWVGGTDQTRKHVYKYSTNGNIDSSSIAGKYQYALPTHPHAVTAVIGIATALPTINVNVSPSITCNTTYNAENKVATIDNGIYHNDFTYGIDGNRYRCDFYSYINSVKTYQGSKVYIGNCEFGYNATGVQTYARTIIKAPTGVCAVYQDSNYVKEFYYVHTDYQGSWLAITNSNKAVTNRYSYDAWGRPRNVNDWTLKSVGITSALTNLNSFQPRFDRGYTGHEIMSGFGLINMNGRLYDPYLQRFLSPDPVVQAPNNSQSYNRYSYCMNNPLMYTDPSGYSWLGDRWKWAQRTGDWAWNHRGEIATIGLGIVATCVCPGLGAIYFGGMMGGAATNGGSLNAGSWNWKSGSTWGGVIGGAIAGGVGLGLPAAMTTSGACATASIAMTSFMTTGIMNASTGGNSGSKVAFGFGSIDLDNGNVDYLGKHKGWQNVGYALGALANIGDIAKGIDNFTHWSDKLKQQYNSYYTGDDCDYEVNHNGMCGSNYCGGDNAGYRLSNDNVNEVYGAPNPTLADYSCQPHDLAWDAVGSNASPIDFVTNTKALGADWTLSGRSLYLGLANLTTNPSQAIGCIGLGIGSGILFIPKSIFWLFQ